MIIIHLSGGIGNQLFQYAAAKALAMARGTTLKADCSNYATASNRSFELQHLIAGLEVATAAEIKCLQPAGNLQKLLQYLKPRHNRTYYRERHFHYDPQFQNCGSNVYLKGLFQTEKYFATIKEYLQNNIQPAPELIANVQHLATTIQQEESVSIHIRRGDYLNPATLAYHGVQGVAYYQAAIATMRKRIPNANFYIFTDDADWTKNNLTVADAVFVSQTYSKTHYEDFYLMSCCKHQIIANSSFSWWGAYLNKNEAKIVIAPKQWFNQAPLDSKDILPGSWIKL